MCVFLSVDLRVGIEEERDYEKPQPFFLPKTRGQTEEIRAELRWRNEAEELRKAVPIRGSGFHVDLEVELRLHRCWDKMVLPRTHSWPIAAEAVLLSSSVGQRQLIAELSAVM